METEFVQVEVADYVATLTMKRPPVNAISKELLEQLTWAFDSFSDRDDVRAAVLTGQGKIFCAGADIKSRADTKPEAGDKWQNSRRSRETFHSIVECQVPVVGAINGPALGAGLAIAALCDILVSSDRGSLGLPEINGELLGGGAMRCDCLGIAAEIAAKSPIAMKLAKQAMNAIEEMSLRDGYRYEQGMTAELGSYEDSKEAMRAFVEKRAPVFKGC